ncbi:UNVERIFIED_CONTAM: hypothetical protein O8I53_07755 [Campylobacter lari]
MFSKLRRSTIQKTSNQQVFEYAVNSEAKKAKKVSASVTDKRTNFFVALILILPAILILTTFTIIPFIFNIYGSVTNNDGSFSGLQNFQALFQDSGFAVGVRNSFIYALLVLPLTMFFSILISSLIANLINKTLKGF